MSHVIQNGTTISLFNQSRTQTQTQTPTQTPTPSIEVLEEVTPTPKPVFTDNNPCDLLVGPPGVLAAFELNRDSSTSSQHCQYHSNSTVVLHQSNGRNVSQDLETVCVDSQDGKNNPPDVEVNPMEELHTDICSDDDQCLTLGAVFKRPQTQSKENNVVLINQGDPTTFDETKIEDDGLQNTEIQTNTDNSVQNKSCRLNISKIQIPSSPVSKSPELSLPDSPVLPTTGSPERLSISPPLTLLTENRGLTPIPEQDDLHNPVLPGPDITNLGEDIPETDEDDNICDNDEDDNVSNTDNDKGVSETDEDDDDSETEGKNGELTTPGNDENSDIADLARTHTTIVPVSPNTPKLIVKQFSELNEQKTTTDRTLNPSQPKQHSRESIVDILLEEKALLPLDQSPADVQALDRLLNPECISPLDDLNAFWVLRETIGQSDRDFYRDIMFALNFHTNPAIKDLAAVHLASCYVEEPEETGTACVTLCQNAEASPSSIFSTIALLHCSEEEKKDLEKKWDPLLWQPLREELDCTKFNDHQFVQQLLAPQRPILIQELNASITQVPENKVIPEHYCGVHTLDDEDMRSNVVNLASVHRREFDTKSRTTTAFSLYSTELNDFGTVILHKDEAFLILEPDENQVSKELIAKLQASICSSVKILKSNSKLTARNGGIRPFIILHYLATARTKSPEITGEDLEKFVDNRSLNIEYEDFRSRQIRILLLENFARQPRRS